MVTRETRETKVILVTQAQEEPPNPKVTRAIKAIRVTLEQEVQGASMDQRETKVT